MRDRRIRRAGRHFGGREHAQRAQQCRRRRAAQIIELRVKLAHRLGIAPGALHRVGAQHPRAARGNRISPARGQIARFAEHRFGAGKIRQRQVDLAERAQHVAARGCVEIRRRRQLPLCLLDQRLGRRPLLAW
jgi:hypothetical protein